MTENQIIDLGFKKESSCDDEKLYYYTYDIAYGLSLITEMSDEIINDQWSVEFFDTFPLIRFTEPEELKQLIEILKSKICYE